MYGKLFQGAFTGSLFGSGPTVFAVWAYVIANAYDSHIELNPRLLAACIGTDTQDIQRAIDFLCQPDPDSRNPDDSGARLVRLDAGGFQYHVPSWQKYQDLRHAEDRREQNRVAAQKYRERQQPSSTVINSQQASASVSDSQHESAESAHVDVDVNVEKEKLPSVAKRNDKNRATSFPNDFLITSNHRSKAKRLGLDVAAEFEQFRDDALSKGKTFVVWELAFSAWLGRAHQFSGGKTAPPIDYDRLTREIEERDETN